MPDNIRLVEPVDEPPPEPAARLPGDPMIDQLFARRPDYLAPRRSPGFALGHLIFATGVSLAIVGLVWAALRVVLTLSG